MAMIGNLRNQENIDADQNKEIDRDFVEIGKIAYFSKNENGSRQDKIGSLGIKIVQGVIIPLILCDKDLYIVETGEFEDNDTKFNGRFFYEGKFRYMIIPSSIISILSSKDSRDSNVTGAVHIFSK